MLWSANVYGKSTKPCSFSTRTASAAIRTARRASLPSWSRRPAAKSSSAVFGKIAAWPIRSKARQGHVLVDVRQPGDAINSPGLRRQLEITESILRFLMLKIEPRIVDALVAHAQSLCGGCTRGAAPVEEAPVAVAPRRPKRMSASRKKCKDAGD